MAPTPLAVTHPISSPQTASTSELATSDKTIKLTPAKKLVNGYYQSVFRLTLSESELTTPISTHIHVQFTSPLVYDENYEIRLVIGDQLSSNASVNNQNELTDTGSLSILQADKNDKSMAANYMLDTVKLTKNADGTYYAYLTTHTPAMMGQNPIRFNDAKHAAELMSTNAMNGRVIESPTADMLFDIKNATLTNNPSTVPEVPDSTTSDKPVPSQPATKPAKPSTDVTDVETDSTTLKTPATITVNNGQANIDIETSNEMIMGMMSNYRFNDVKATAKGTHWLVTLPVNALSKTIATSMTISLVVGKQLSDETPTDNQNTDTSVSDNNGAISDSSTTADANVLQDGVYKVPFTNYKTGTTTASSMNRAIMGKTPIDFTDTNHAAKLLSTNLVDNYYQSVFRLTLTESEIKAPITTNIHVDFTSPLVYDHRYDIHSLAQPFQSTSVDERGTTGEESTHALRILQADNDEESMAASYMLDTVKISKNEDGTYYAYLTTHTPSQSLLFQGFILFFRRTILSMSNLSRTAVLFSTAVLGGALLTTSVTSTATVAYAAEITASNLSFDMTSNEPPNLPNPMTANVCFIPNNHSPNIFVVFILTLTYAIPKLRN
ncbi:hypothetical protein H7R52_01535 [Weissella confusa]|uniref:NEAT domain-containing protein n=1 Tax=Weissella confusa TaxID=1583 RepID=A0A923SSP2_WEICO|nr:hypothetical protein [Weissella confusa]